MSVILTILSWISARAHQFSICCCWLPCCYWPPCRYWSPSCYRPSCCWLASSTTYIVVIHPGGTVYCCWHSCRFWNPTLSGLPTVFRVHAVVGVFAVAGVSAVANIPAVAGVPAVIGIPWLCYGFPDVCTLQCTYSKLKQLEYWIGEFEKLSNYQI